MVVFLDDYKILVLKLLIEIMLVVNVSFIFRINFVIGDEVFEIKVLVKGSICKFFKFYF